MSSPKVSQGHYGRDPIHPLNPYFIVVCYGVNNYLLVNYIFSTHVPRYLVFVVVFGTKVLPWTNIARSLPYMVKFLIHDH